MNKEFTWEELVEFMQIEHNIDIDIEEKILFWFLVRENTVSSFSS